MICRSRRKLLLRVTAAGALPAIVAGCSDSSGDSAFDGADGGADGTDSDESTAGSGADEEETDGSDGAIAGEASSFDRALEWLYDPAAVDAERDDFVFVDAASLVDHRSSFPEDAYEVWTRGTDFGPGNYVADDDLEWVLFSGTTRLDPNVTVHAGDIDASEVGSALERDGYDRNGSVEGFDLYGPADDSDPVISATDRTTLSFLGRNIPDDYSVVESVVESLESGENLEVAGEAARLALDEHDEPTYVYNDFSRARERWWVHSVDEETTEFTVVFEATDESDVRHEVSEWGAAIGGDLLADAEEFVELDAWADGTRSILSGRYVTGTLPPEFLQ